MTRPAAKGSLKQPWDELIIPSNTTGTSRCAHIQRIIGSFITKMCWLQGYPFRLLFEYSRAC